MTQVRIAILLAFGVAFVAGCGGSGRRSSPGFDSGPTRLDGGVSPGFDSAMPRVDSGPAGFDSGSPRFDSGGFPRDAGGVPSFDAGIPTFDGGLPSFEGGLPGLDGAIGGACTTDGDCAAGEMCCELIPGLSLCLASCTGFP